MTQLIEGREKEPIVMVIFGVPGVGKTALAAGAPKPIFIGPERNKEITSLKFPQTKTHSQLMGYLSEIEQGKHDGRQIRTVVLDAITTEEKIINQEIMSSEPGKTMETARKGYGKAWSESLNKLFEVRDILQSIADKKEMNIIVLGHSIKVDFNDPMLMTNYDTYEMALHKGKKFDHNSVFINWASSVLFLNWKTYATEDGKHATAVGRREIKTEYRPSHLAKNRYNFPETIEMLDDAHALKVGQVPQTFGVVLKYIEHFYASGDQANTFQNDLNILLHNIKNLMSQVKDQSILPQIELAVNGEYSSGAPNINNLKVIHDRVFEIVSNQ